MALVAPSILAANFANLQESILKVQAAGADWLHLDVMDGAFVPNLTFGAPVVKDLRKITKMHFDAHLMIYNPHKYIENFVKAGVDSITIHIEAYDDLAEVKKVVAQIKALGKYAGVSIKPLTPVSSLETLIQDLDLVLLMSVEPGFAGQEFMPEVLPKIAELKNLAQNAGKKFGHDLAAGEFAIEIDGGIKPGAIATQVKELGVNIIVAGSAVFKAENMQQVIAELK